MDPGHNPRKAGSKRLPPGAKFTRKRKGKKRGNDPSSSRLSPLSLRYVRRALMDLKIDEGLKALLDSGKEKGYLTYSQVNDYLPDDAVNPEKLDQLLLVLEEHGIELIDESEAEERETGPDPARTEEDHTADLD